MIAFVHLEVAVNDWVGTPHVEVVLGERGRGWGDRATESESVYDVQLTTLESRSFMYVCVCVRLKRWG